MYARVVNGEVVETFTPPAGTTIGQCFHGDVASTFVNVPANISPSQGWTYNGTSFAPPSPPSKTLKQRAIEALGTTVLIKSASIAALDGNYSIDGSTQGKIAALSTYILVNGKFPAGVSAYPWPDSSGSAHIFPSTTSFESFATAIADYVATLDQIVAFGVGTLPSPSITIP